jgi:hypothetical protein
LVNPHVPGTLNIGESGRLVTGTRRVVITVGALAIAIATPAYLGLPLVRTEAAGMGCQVTMPGNGAYTVEWKLLPVAHWECIATPSGEPTRTIDLGWWPS